MLLPLLVYHFYWLSMPTPHTDLISSYVLCPPPPQASLIARATHLEKLNRRGTLGVITGVTPRENPRIVYSKYNIVC